jgi:hypothetical protein
VAVAKVRGREKIPEPTMEPTTMAVSMKSVNFWVVWVFKTNSLLLDLYLFWRAARASRAAAAGFRAATYTGFRVQRQDVIEVPINPGTLANPGILAFSIAAPHPTMPSPNPIRYTT